MKFSQDFIEKVQDSSNIVDVISQYTQLKQAAGGFMGRCPFPDHPEKTPSFSVSETKQVYNCFGCHKKGNIFIFVQQYMGMSFPEAVEYLAGRAHIALPDPAPGEHEEQDQQSKKKKALLEVNRLAVQYFHEQYKTLPKNHPAKTYVSGKRLLSDETINEFKIGYASDEWDGLARYLEGKNVPMTLAEEARLVKARPQGNGYYDIFRERIIFPIFNLMGEPIAFGGRIISQGEPKYLNSGETPVFHKGKVLYGLSQTARYIRGDDQAIIVEGYMDLVSLYQAGIRNVAATMGTALTFEHGRLLGRMTKNIVAVFDGDQAGRTAAERSLALLLAADVHPKGLVLPDEMDPDDYVKSQGSESLMQLIQSSADLFSMVLGMWTLGFRGDASEKVKLADRLKPVFDSIFDSRLRRLYLEEAARKIGVEPAWLANAFKAGKTAPIQNQGPKTALTTIPLTGEKISPSSVSTGETENWVKLKGASKAEGLLLGLSLKNRNNFNVLIESDLISVIRHAGVQALLQKAATTYRQDPEKFDKLAGLLTSFVDMPELLFAPGTGEADPINELSVRANEREMEGKLLNDCIKRIREQHLQALADQLAAEIKVQPTSEKMEQFMNVKRDLLALGKEL
jgi:DNA primase